MKQAYSNSVQGTSDINRITQRLLFLAASLLFSGLLTSGPVSALQIGERAPDFNAMTSHGEVNFYSWGEGKYTLLFSHPLDFTPVCTTELAVVHGLKGRLDSLGAKAMGLSLDSVDRHTVWERDVAFLAGDVEGLNFPIIADDSLRVAKLYGMLGDDESVGLDRTAADNRTARTVFIIDPEKVVRAMITYPMSTGRNFHEIVRVLESVRIHDKYGLATPADWILGDDVVLPVELDEAEARKRYGEVRVTDLPSSDHGLHNYLRWVRSPEREQAPSSDEVEERSAEDDTTVEDGTGSEGASEEL